MSSAVMPDSIAKPISEIISEAFIPATCAPITRPSSLRVTRRTNPSGASKESARPLPPNGNLAAFTSKPFSFASFSVKPTVASSGSLKTTAGSAV